MKPRQSEGSDAQDPEPIYLPHQQAESLEALARGEITDASASGELPVDRIVNFGLEKGLFQKGLKLFPDPRKSWEIPIDVLLLPQVLQRLNNEHSLVLAPHMLNSAELITKLGYNVQVLEQGFNRRNIHERQTAFHGETLKHVLMAVDSEELTQWFNSKLLPLWRGIAGKYRTRRYIMDGMRIEVPSHLVKSYRGAGTVENEDGSFSHGYKVVWLQEILESRNKNGVRFHRGMLVAVRVGQIEEHDLSLGRWLVSEFPLEEGDSLVFDRGFIDGAWITELKKSRKIDVCVPLRRNMKLSQEARLRAYTERNDQWLPHPTREGQWVQRLLPWDLQGWDECAVLKSGALVKWKKKDGSFEEVLFVSTRDDASVEEILSLYDERAEIEESHRQLKCFQGIEVLPSKKWEHVVFRILMGMMAFNLLSLFLIHEGCPSMEASSLKTLRQKRRHVRDPKMIIYTAHGFGIIGLMDLMAMLVRCENPEVRKKLHAVFERARAREEP